MSSFSPVNQSLPDSSRVSSRSKGVLLLNWWYFLCAPPDVSASASFIVREQARRGRIASLIILGILIAAVMLVPIIIFAAPTLFLLPWAITSAIVGMIFCLIAIPLNRSQHVKIAGILLLIAVDVIVAGIVLSERNGLDPLFLSMFDLLVISELIAASLLDPTSVFWVAVFNTLLILFDINVQPRSMMWMQMVMSQQLTYSLLARPIALYFVVAAVSYLWVRSALNALHRADRAELIAELEKREVAQKQQLEQEIEQILATHVRVANGDFNARAPIYQNHALWQISTALNTLLARLKSALQAERNLRSTTEEVAQLRMALSQWKSGQPLQWFSRRNTMLEPLVIDINRVLSTRQVPQTLIPTTSPSPTQNAQGESTTGALAPVRPRDTSKDTPLPDNSGFFIQQQSWSQFPNTSSYREPHPQQAQYKKSEEGQY